MNWTRWSTIAGLMAAGIGVPASTATGTGRAADPAAVVSLTGVAVPTKGVIVSPGTQMSTYGHLRLSGGTPLAHRYVYVETRPLSNWTAPYTAVSTGLTTSTGYFYANWKAGANVDVRLSYVSSDAAAPSANSYLGPIRPLPRPTWLDGVSRPTKATTVVRTDTKMSAFGHLRALYSTGEVGPYAGQRVRVQLRPANVPNDGPDQDYFTNAGEAVTTSTGYFYTNWTAGTSYRGADVRVRLVFPGGYTTVTPSVRELGVIHVQ